MALLFTEHDMDVVFGFADRVIAMNRGRIIAEGTPDEIRSHETKCAPFISAPLCRRRLRMLEVRNLSVHHGRAQLLFDLSFSARAGEVLVLVGRNGAGKSTTLKAIMGLLPEVAGSVRFAGDEIGGRAPHHIARLGLGYVPEERRIFTDLTVAENLEVGRPPVRAQGPTRRAGALTASARCSRSWAKCSTGPAADVRRRAADATIARSLMGNRKAILLDEPSEGPIVVERIADSVKELKREGLCVILSEQNLNFARAIADRAVVIERGSVRYEGDFAALAADPALAAHYLAA